MTASSRSASSTARSPRSRPRSRRTRDSPARCPALAPRTRSGPPPTRPAIRPGRSANARQENGWTVLDVAGYTDPGPRPARRRADPGRRRAAGVRGPPHGPERDARSHELRRRGDGRAARPRRHRRPRGGQPGVEGLPRLAAAHLRVDGHARDLVLERGRRLREGGREPVLAGGVGRRRGHEHAHVPDPRQQRARDGEVELERRQPRRATDFTLVGDARLRLPVDEPVVHVALQPGVVHLARSRTTSTPRGPTSTRCTTGCTTGRTSSASQRPPSTRRRSTSPRAASQSDPEHGNAQAGGIVGGPPGFASRDNANQFTPADGIVPVTNMFLWQPIPATFYSPCVDGDYDMSVIAHEYGHMVSNRMVAGPNQNLAGNQAAGDGRELVRPAGGGVPQLAGARADRRREPVRRRPVRHRRPPGGHPQLRHEREPAELLGRRLRLRLQPGRRLHPADAGARRRRDLVGHELRHPPGVHQRLQRRRSRPATSGCSRRASGATARSRSARATGAGRSSCSTRGC